MGGKIYNVQKNDLLYPDLSFRITGVLFEVFKQIGGGHLEKVYQKAVAHGLQKQGIKFSEQVYTPLRFEDKIIGRYYLDFLIEDKIVLELKRGQFVSAQVIHQTRQYLESLKLQLALASCFTYSGVYVKRIVNIQK